MESKKIIHLHIMNCADGQSDYYFGSVRALYAKFGDKLDIAYDPLCMALKTNRYYRYDDYVVKVGEIIRCKQSS